MLYWDVIVWLFGRLTQHQLDTKMRHLTRDGIYTHQTQINNGQNFPEHLSINQSQSSNNSSRQPKYEHYRVRIKKNYKNQLKRIAKIPQLEKDVNIQKDNRNFLKINKNTQWH